MPAVKVKLKIFGIAHDIMGGRVIFVDVCGQTVGELRASLFKDYPKLKDLNSLLIAVNQAYASDTILIKETDEIAIIPPVSGG